MYKKILKGGHTGPPGSAPVGLVCVDVNQCMHDKFFNSLLKDTANIVAMCVCH